MPSALITTASTGLSAAASAVARSSAAATSSAVGAHGRNEEDDDRVDAGVGEQRRQRRRVGLRRSPSRACRPGSRRSPRPAAPREARRASPRRAAAAPAPRPHTRRRRGCRARRRSSSRATRRPRGSGWVEKQRRDVDQLLERCRPEDAGLAEERVDGRVGACERRRVRARGPPAARRVPLLSARIGLRRATRRAIRAEAARVPERLEVEQDRARSPRRPPTTRADRSRTRRPCCRSRRTPRGRGPRARLPRAARGRAPRSATRSRCCPGGAARAANVALRLGAGDRDAEAVRADQPRAVRADEREQPLLALAPSLPDLGEARRDDDERPDARAAAPARPRRARRRRARR